MYFCLQYRGSLFYVRFMYQKIIVYIEVTYVGIFFPVRILCKDLNSVGWVAWLV